MTDTETPKIPWRTVAGARIGGVAIVLAALIGIGTVKSEGSTNARGGPGGGFGGGPPGQQFPFQGPQGQPPPFMQQQAPQQFGPTGP